MKSTFTVQAPTRVDLAGGTLDLWPLFCLTEGARTINLALDLFAESTFALSASDRFTVDFASPTGAKHSITAPLSVEQCRKLDPTLRFPVSIASQYIRQCPSIPKKRISIAWKTRVPMGSGLGGSSTLGVSLLRGLGQVFGDFQKPGWQWRLLGIIKDAEATFLETPTGTQDYLAALFGGLSSFYSRAGEIVYTGYKKATFEALSDRVLVLFSGEQHHSGRSNWEIYKSAIDKDAATLRGIHGIRDLAEKMDAALQASKTDWSQVGRLLGEEWKIRRELFKVSTPRLDQLLEMLTKKNVYGAKVCGAAAGGSLLVLVDPARRESVAREMAAAGVQVLPTDPVLHGVKLS